MEYHQQRHYHNNNQNQYNPPNTVNSFFGSNSNSSNSPTNTKITSGEADLYLDQYNFTTTAALVGSIDRKVFVLLRDGRHLFGVLRTYDQFANLILQHCVQRIYLMDSKQYAEETLGIYMIRGENVVYMGEIDIDKEDLPLETLTKIPFSDAQALQHEKTKKWLVENKIKRDAFIKKGFTYEFNSNDLY
ncbi:related to Sm-like protein LSm1 [Saccharomycodes ludwigii]|uniref:U6 snRNA-associated Sm-like protein LSm1 n=1 Tax=Saccharomycodes ludwigii TaxID=36035 RepID=A0A376B4U9_9ASCO|nr:hypothetical protein SCDLUD_002437 [Saccharomycodes ludwigii]KAH3900974.1 hypothetical protein SCDLUD_002437 [Saccharomycodes ludwigii]SSD59683.1 related to Sm-like protein LSm1 [Saccharomycodes ludwigii]